MAAHTIFTSKTIFASLVAIGLAGTAQARAPTAGGVRGTDGARQGRPRGVADQRWR
jgi:hypothetical protein